MIHSETLTLAGAKQGFVSEYKRQKRFIASFISYQPRLIRILYKQPLPIFLATGPPFHKEKNQQESMEYNKVGFLK